MQVTEHDVEQLAREHRALMSDYGRAQAREIERLQAQAMGLRAEVILRETALAWAGEDRAALEQAIPGLPKRVALARRVDALLARIQDLMRERLRPERRKGVEAPAPAAMVTAASGQGEPDALEASLRAADLVICQTGCLSHGTFWRVQDHCKRTGKACVLVEQPESVRIVRIHAASDGDSPARLAAVQAEPPT